jgi:hypothetical protein
MSYLIKYEPEAIASLEKYKRHQPKTNYQCPTTDRLMRLKRS